MDSTLDENERGNGRTRGHRDERPLTTTVCVVGLGYVGLPLAVEFDHAGHSVTGYDIDETKVTALGRGVDTTGDVPTDTLAEGDVTFTSDAAEIAQAEYVVIAVPTPVDENRTPRLDYVETAARTVGEVMESGTTVILESTVYPGATREVMIPSLAEASGLTCGEEFVVGYSPERATPGDDEHDLSSVVKVVSGQTEAVTDDVAALYETVVDAGVHRAPSMAVAEATKVVENVQRDVNIALMNELSMAFERMDADIDTRAVLDAAGTKWNFHQYRPGLVGGHCIPVDPYFFAYQSERSGFVPELTLTGRAVNERMPAHVAELTIKALNERGKPLKGSRVLVLGVTYKPDVADIRSSKVADVIAHLKEYDIDVEGMDPYVEGTVLREEFGIEPMAESPAAFDAVILATLHHEFRTLDYADLGAYLADDPVVIDVTGGLSESRLAQEGIGYRSV